MRRWQRRCESAQLISCQLCWWAQAAAGAMMHAGASKTWRRLLLTEVGVC